MKKYRIPYELLEPTKQDCPMTKLAWYLQAVMDTDEKLHVSNMWISENTKEKIDKYILKYLTIIQRSKREAEKHLGMYNLMVGCAVARADEVDKNLERFGEQLEDDYVYYGQVNKDCAYEI